jgi:hypothetical protein
MSDKPSDLDSVNLAALSYVAFDGGAKRFMTPLLCCRQLARLKLQSICIRMPPDRGDIENETD